MEVHLNEAEESENMGEHHYQHHRQLQRQHNQQFSQHHHSHHHQSEWLGASALACASNDEAPVEAKGVIEPGKRQAPQPKSSASKGSKVPRAKLCFYTILIFVSYTIYGIAYNIWGPTWMDLIALLQSSQDQMSYGNSLMAIGYILGSFTSPFLFEHFGRQLFIAFYIVLIATAILVTPLLANYYVFLGASVAFGVGEGGFDTGINAWIFEMYLDENGPLVQAMYFFYGLGTLFSPLICLNFLSDDNFVDENYQLVSSLVRPNESSAAEQQSPLESSLSVSVIQLGQHGLHHASYFFPWLKRPFVVGDFVQSKVEVPFIIVSSMLFATAAIHLLCHFFLRYEADEEATILRLKNPLPPCQAEVVDADEKVKCLPAEMAHCSSGNAAAGGHSNYGTAEVAKAALDQSKTSERQLPLLDSQSKMKMALLVLIGGAMACFYDGMENISFEYMTSFLVNSALSIGESEAAQMVSALSAAYTIARGVGILLILKVPPRFLLLFDFALIFAGLSLLYFNMASSRTGLYGGLVALGAGTATFMPTMFSYFEEHIRLTDRVCALLTLSCALVSTVDPIIVGRLISSLPAIVLYINYASIVVVAFAFTLFELVLAFWR